MKYTWGKHLAQVLALKKIEFNSSLNRTHITRDSLTRCREESALNPSSPNWYLQLLPH